MKNVALYIRVSTLDQAVEGYSIGEQRDRLTNYCKAKNWSVKSVYVDGGYTGSNIDRPDLSRLIDNIKDYDAVLVYKLNRLSRSQKDTLMLVEDVFLKNNTEFISLHENFDTSTPYGRAMIGILSVFAQLDREQIKETTIMGKVGRAKSGLHHGGMTPIGYNLNNGKLEINDDESSLIKMIFKEFLSGKRISEVTESMINMPGHKYGSFNSDVKVRRVLTHKLYAGYIVNKGITYQGVHEPIISVHDFELAKNMLESSKWSMSSPQGQKRPFQSKYLLTGLIYCGQCGSRYAVTSRYRQKNGIRTNDPVYCCYSQAKTVKSQILDDNCKNRKVNVKELEKSVLEHLLELPTENINLNKKENKTNELLELQIDNLTKQKSRLLDLYQLGSLSFDDIGERVDKIETQILSVEKEIKINSSENDNLDKVSTLLEVKNSLLRGKDKDKKKALVHALVNRIIVTDDSIDILLNY